jgi:hypothetical protein
MLFPSTSSNIKGTIDGVREWSLSLLQPNRFASGMTLTIVLNIKTVRMLKISYSPINYLAKKPRKT